MLDYSVGLTAEPFLYQETKLMAEFILNGEEPEKLKKRNLEENLMKHKSINSLSRVNSPIFRRLKVLDEELLRNFVNSDLDSSRFILLYAIMKTDRLVNEFINEIYKDKIMLRKEYIEKYEFDMFYESKAQKSEKLYKASESSKYKLRQVMFKILVDAGLLKKEKENFKIIKPLVNQQLIDMLDQRGDKEYIMAIKGGGF